MGTSLQYCTDSIEKTKQTPTKSDPKVKTYKSQGKPKHYERESQQTTTNGGTHIPGTAVQTKRALLIVCLKFSKKEDKRALHMKNKIGNYKHSRRKKQL